MKHELFSEVYSCYYQVVRQILAEADGQAIKEADMNRIASAYGYEESGFFIVPKLIQGEWDLLDKNEEGYLSKIEHFKSPLTNLQKAWLKALMADSRFSLFFSDSQIRDMEDWLRDIEPLFDVRDFLYFDQYKDGDLYSSVIYREHFQQILKSIEANTVLIISYYSGKNNMSTQTLIPCRLEYSAKDDKFRLFGVRLNKRGVQSNLIILNVARICQIAEAGPVLGERPDMEVLMKSALCKEPVVLEISNERNALERTMLHFSCYQKRTEKLGDTGKYICRIYYNKMVETELLIQILSFGPVIKVLGPEPFLAQVRERVRKQKELFAIKDQ
jgi:hypothetical protein